METLALSKYQMCVTVHKDLVCQPLTEDQSDLTPNAATTAATVATVAAIKKILT